YSHYMRVHLYSLFFYTHTPTTYIYTLSLHDALPILPRARRKSARGLERSATRLRLARQCARTRAGRKANPSHRQVPGQPVRLDRSEEHTSELQSLRHLVCRLLLEKKNKKKKKKQYIE